MSAGVHRAWLHVRAALISARANGRELLGRILARLVGPRSHASELAAERIDTILVCRINGRMGNAVMLTPLVALLHESFPHAAIDLALSFPKAQELLRALPGVRRVILFPHKGPGLLRGYWRALRAVRAQRYDLAIDPIPNSTSGRTVLALCRARLRAGFAATTQWAPLTHAAPLPEEFMHQAVKSVFLMARLLGVPFDAAKVRLSLHLSAEEIAAGARALAQAVGRGSFAPSREAFGFFAHATAFKSVDPGWWRAFWEAFLAAQPEAVPIEFLPTPTSAPLDPRFAALHLSSPRAVAAAMAATRLLISADAGPMHLASSTDVPTVALFRASHVALYRPLKPVDQVIDVRHCSPQEAAALCARLWRENARTAAPPAAVG